MYTGEEYKKRIKELYPIARDWIANKTPEEGLELVAKMDPVDAYILGRIIGGIIQADADMKELERAFSGIVAVTARRAPNVNFNINNN